MVTKSEIKKLQIISGIFIVVSIVFIAIILVLYTDKSNSTETKEPEVYFPVKYACYNITPEELNSIFPLTDDVDCDSLHNSETYKVSTWPDSRNPWVLSETELTQVAESICMPWEISEESSLNYWLYYIPTQEQWAQGANWIRCDAAIAVEENNGDLIFASWQGLKSNLVTSNYEELEGITKSIIEESGIEWKEDTESPKWVDYEARIYDAVEDGCTIHIFNEGVPPSRWAYEISYSNNAYDAWIGIAPTGEGVILQALAGDIPCALEVARILGWKPPEVSDDNYLQAGNPFQLCLYSYLRDGTIEAEAINICKFQFERDGKAIPEEYLKLN
jgi:hypothetical protein